MLGRDSFHRTQPNSIKHIPFEEDAERMPSKAEVFWSLVGFAALMLMSYLGLAS